MKSIVVSGFILAAIGLIGGRALAQSDTDGEVNVYSARHYDSDLAIYDEFTKKTGIKVNLIEAGGDALIERLAREAEASPADVFITADAGMLWRAEMRGVFQPISNEEILSRAPAQFRDPENNWVGLSKRARIIIYNKRKGLPDGVSSYEDLANRAYQGMICVRSSSNVYNQSLLASLIHNDGADKAANWVSGIVSNFARAPQGNDTTQIEAVAAGKCRLSIVNSYYLARYIGSSDARTKKIGDRVGFLFPNQSGRGTHVNISGAGITKYAPHKDNAERLIAFLLTDTAQRAFAAGNNEYPVVSGVAPIGPVAEFGDFKADSLNMGFLGEYQPAAVRLFDEGGWK